jgi:hypothetical protein
MHPSTAICREHPVRHYVEHLAPAGKTNSIRTTSSEWQAPQEVAREGIKRRGGSTDVSYLHGAGDWRWRKDAGEQWWRSQDLKPR